MPGLIMICPALPLDAPPSSIASPLQPDVHNGDLVIVAAVRGVRRIPLKIWQPTATFYRSSVPGMQAALYWHA
jgi:hypothetical protein